MFMKKRTKDLILDNDYNSNNIYFEALPQIQMDQSFKNKTDSSNDCFNHHRLQVLEEYIVDELNARLLYPNTNKEILYEHYYTLIEELDLLQYNEIEFTVLYCENLKLNIKDFYKYLLPKMKRKILQVLRDQNYIKRLNREGVKLF